MTRAWSHAPNEAVSRRPGRPRRRPAAACRLRDRLRTQDRPRRQSRELGHHALQRIRAGPLRGRRGGVARAQVSAGARGRRPREASTGRAGPHRGAGRDRPHRHAGRPGARHAPARRSPHVPGRDRSDVPRRRSPPGQTCAGHRRRAGGSALRAHRRQGRRRIGRPPPGDGAQPARSARHGALRPDGDTCGRSRSASCCWPSSPCSSRGSTADSLDRRARATTTRATMR